MNVGQFAHRFIVSTVAALVVSGCVMIPDYQQPDATHVPDTWPDGPAYPDMDKPQSERPAAAVSWRDFFASARLEDLIAQALSQNPDVRLAVLKVKKTRAKYQLQSAKLSPEVTASGSYTRQNSAGNVAQRSRGGGGTSDYYQVGVGITAYELDLFGRVQSLKQSALEQYLATIQARRSAKLSLVAEVANVYLQWVAYDAQLELAQKTLQSRKQALSLIRKRFEVGAASELDLHRAQRAYQSVRITISQLRRSKAQTRNALIALVGIPVPEEPAKGVALTDEWATGIPNPGLPSKLLLRRPDIVAAEHRLKSANARIGAARAAFFPRITLTGSYGTISPELDGLFETGSFIWSFMPKISVPIFDGGRNDANLAMAKVEKRMKVAKYRKTIRTAFREVSDTLAARGTLGQALQARKRLVEETRASYELARQRYKHGVTSYLPVLEAQRAYFDAQQALVDTKLANVANKITLYKVLGGGWRAHSRDRDERDGDDRSHQTSKQDAVSTS